MNEEIPEDIGILKKPFTNFGEEISEVISGETSERIFARIPEHIVGVIPKRNPVKINGDINKIL